MPFLRVIRDKRGYETTYLMHWFREGNRQHSRILYVFRTPGGVRVGRAALEPAQLAQIQAQHPEIDFDWPAVLENRQVIEPAQDQRRPRKRKREDEAPAPVAEAPAPVVPPQSRPVVPAAIEGETPDAQIEYLVAWYPRICQIITDRTADVARREILLALAQRLDPSAWTDADEITAGLQQAAEALERLSRVFSRRRRRPRRNPRGSGDSTPAPHEPTASAPDAEPPPSHDAIDD